MSAEAKVAMLEGLLERIDSNRRPRPLGLLSALKSSHSPASSLDEEPELLIEETETPTVVATKATTSAATPMEAALAGEVDDDGPELEIVIDDDEPELLIEEPDAPTAPLGTRAPRPAPQRPVPPRPAAPARPTPPARPQPTAAAQQQPTPGGPQRLALSDSPAAEVAKVVSQPTEISFGDLLDRTLALRPR